MSNAENATSPSGDSGVGGVAGQNAEAFAAAARFIRDHAGADADSLAPIERQGLEQQAIRKWVEGSHGVAFSDDELLPRRVISDKTSEHRVLALPERKRVLKVTWPAYYGQIPVWSDGKLSRRNALPSEYLERQALQCEVFASDIVLEGINVSERPSMIIGEPPGQPSFVISQEFLTAADQRNPVPTEAQIAHFFQAHGFVAVPGSYFGFIRAPDGVLVVDAKPDNFVLTTEGVVPIDLQMARSGELAASSLAATGLVLPD